MRPKFKPGDRVKLKSGEEGRARTGVVISVSKLRPEFIEVRRGKMRAIEAWHQDSWALASGVSLARQ